MTLHALDPADLVAALPGVIVVYAADAPRFTVLAVSDALVASVQRPREALVGRPLGEAFPADGAVPSSGGSGLAMLRASLEEALRTRRAQRLSRQRYDLQHPDGRWEERYWDAVNIPVVGPDGAVRCVVHQTEDATARERAAAALARAEQGTARILGKVSDGHLVLDREFRVVTVNAAAARVVGKSPEEMVGRTHWELFPASEDDDIGRAYRRVVAERVEQHLTRHYVADGYDLHVEIDAYPGVDGGVDVFWRDVSEQRRTEVANAYLAAVVRASGEAMLGLTLDGIVQSWNPAAERLLGWRADEIVGQSIARLAPPERRAEQHEILAGVRAGRTFSRETTRLARDGRPVDVILTTGPVLGAAGEPVGLSAVLVDITERKRAEAALAVEKARLSQVLEQAPVAVAVLRGRVAAELVFELVNPRYEEMLPAGRAPLGRRLGDALPEVVEAMAPVLQRVLDTGEPFVANDHAVPLDRDGDGAAEDYWFNFVYTPLVLADGTVDGIVGVGTEVTDSVRARRDAERLHRMADAARARAERLQALTAALARARTLDDVADVVVADMVVALGARTGALAGRAPDGDALLLLRTVGFPEPVAAGVRRQPLELRSPLTECYRTQAPIWIESREGPAGLDERYPPIAAVWDALGVNSAAFVPLVAAGEVVGVISFAYEQPQRFAPAERDFLLSLGRQAALAVERARLFDAERAARAEAERANHAKSEFLAVMSHELRTPLNAIGGYAELLEMGIRGPVTPQQREDLRRVQTSQRHLLGLINEVLNYAKLETGTVHYDLRDVRLRDALAGAEALVAPQAHAKALELVVEPCPPSLAVRADPEKLRQILVNLLGNAVKFTDRGGRVALTCAPAGAQMHVVVRDTGIGIAADQLHRIFEPFVQVRADLTRTAEGTGLGLAISRDLARGMGGDLTADSTPGEGSAFTLVLPTA